MPEIIKSFNQGDDIWFTERIASLGGSSIASAVAGGQGKTRNSLLYRMAGEILTGQKYEGYQNDHMLRGLEQEPDAIAAYEWEMDCEVERVAMVRMSPHKHFSPDSLVGNDGIIEVKAQIPSVHIETILHDKVPAAYRKQCAWGLHVCKREWIDFISYSPLVKDRPIWIKRTGRDEKLIKELDEGADKFITELLMIVERIKNGK